MQIGHQASLLERNGRKKEHGVLPVLSCATQSTLVATSISHFLTAAIVCHVVVQNNGKEMYKNKKEVLHVQIYHGSKISGSQFFLTGHLHCQTMGKEYGLPFCS